MNDDVRSFDCGRALGLVALAAVLLLAATFWVPVNPQLMLTNPTYYHADLLQKIEPRALMGTVAGLLGLSQGGFIILIQVCHLLWAGLLLWGLSRPLPGQGTPPLWTVGLLGFLFVFNTPVFLSNVNSGLVDIPIFTLSLIAVLVLTDGDDAPSPLRLAVGALVMMLAVVGHEKSIFDATLIGAWMLWKAGWRRAGAYYLPVAIFYVLFIAANADAKNAHNWTPADYIKVIPNIWNYLFTNSFNIWGILLAGGFLWVVMAWAATRFVRHGGQTGGQAESLRRGALVLTLLGLSLGPIAVAWDTNRLVAVMWIPTFLLVRETGLAAALSVERRLLAASVVMAVLHIFVPPAFALRMGALPINCYSQSVYMALFRTYTRDFESYPRWITLRIGAQPAFTKGNACWPPHLVR